MINYYDLLQKDIRIEEGAKACIKCGTCTAICAASSFYSYEPRSIVDIVLSRDNAKIEELLKGEMIWYCGECMSCKTRCPRGNAPGLVIMALRSLSQELGLFVESEKGRQQLCIKRTVGDWILNTGYCIFLDGVGTDLHPEQGPVWDWIQKNWKENLARLGGNYQGDGPGMLRKIPEETLEEIRKIFEVTGGLERYEQIEAFSKKKAEEMNLAFGEGLDNEYFQYIYSNNNQSHCKK